MLTFEKIRSSLRHVFLPRVCSIMSYPVATINANATVLEAIDLMIEKKVGSLVVLDERKPVGIFTRRDFYQAVKQRQSLSETNIQIS